MVKCKMEVWRIIMIKTCDNCDESDKGSHIVPYARKYMDIIVTVVTTVTNLLIK